MKSDASKIEFQCDPNEIALKSFFMGPQAENAGWIGDLLKSSFDQWVSWRRELYSSDGCAISSDDHKTPSFLNRKKKIEDTTLELLNRFKKEVPKHSPRYLGHMFSEVSIPALIGHIITLLHNPNNISGESSRVGTSIEEEAIQFLLQMVGYGGKSQGHFTSGGTIANFESIVRARSRSAAWLSAAASTHESSGSTHRDLFADSHMGWDQFNKIENKSSLSEWDYVDHPWKSVKKLEQLYNTKFEGSVILIPENKHYSWKKGCQLLGLGTDAFWPIELDRFGRLSVSHLKKLISQAAIQKVPISMIVSVVGTTELGSIDPVHEVQSVIDEWKSKFGIHFWHHVDAAYGGFMCSMDRKSSKVLSENSTLAIGAIENTNSITLDPHKLGYVPYASGAILVKDQRDYYYKSASDAPYLDYDHLKDKGPFTIEGSRSAAGAVATWMTAKTMGLDASGYGLLLERTFRISDELILKLERSNLNIKVAPGSDSNLVCFTCAKFGEKISVSNERTLKIFNSFSPRADGPFIVSKTMISFECYGPYLQEWTKQWSPINDAEDVVLIRMCIMNPFLGSKQMNIDFLDLFVEELAKVVKTQGEDK